MSTHTFFLFLSAKDLMKPRPHKVKCLLKFPNHVILLIVREIAQGFYGGHVHIPKVFKVCLYGEPMLGHFSALLA